MNDCELVLTALDRAVHLLGQDQLQNEQMRAAVENGVNISLFVCAMGYDSLGLRTNDIEVRIAGTESLFYRGVSVTCNFSSTGESSIANQIKRCTKQLTILNQAAIVETSLNLVYNALGAARMDAVLAEIATMSQDAHRTIRESSS